MIQRTVALLFIALSLIGSSPPLYDYAIVDDSRTTTRGVFPTIQEAIDSGASWIDVRGGEYAGFSLNRPNVTIVMQGARFHNDNDLTIWIDPVAERATITGDWEIYGDNTGVTGGDFFHGTGVYNNASYVTLEGLRCTNLLSFCVINPTVTAHHVTIGGCEIRNVATSPTPQKIAGTSILFINGSSFNTVRDCYIEGQSQAIGTWYGASHNRIYNNNLVNNYGWIIGDGGTIAPRSAIEDYGLDNAINTGNQFYNNIVDGSNGSAFELADELRDVVVRGNTVRNVVAGFWMGGSDDNKSLNATIADNEFYGHEGVVSNWFGGTGSITGNDFIDWSESNTTATIHIPNDIYGDVDIINNTFEGGNGVLRYSAREGTLRFQDNRINTDTTSWILYFADTTNGGHVIADNFIDAPNTFAITANADTQLNIRDNTIYGAIWQTGAYSVIDGNTVYCTEGSWTSLLLNGIGQVARDNRLYCDNTPMVVQSPFGAVVDSNFVAKRDNTTAPPPNCGANNVCRDNWTP